MYLDNDEVYNRYLIALSSLFSQKRGYGISYSLGSPLHTEYIYIIPQSFQ